MHNYVWAHAFPAPELAYGQPGILTQSLSGKLTADKRSLHPEHRAAVILANPNYSYAHSDALQI